MSPRLLADLVYSRAGGADRLADLWLPDGPGPHPLAIYLHGGGWRFGDRHLAPDLSRHFAASGLAMLSIDYRLSTEAIFPAAVIDTLTAVRWARHHAAACDLDPARIALWGSSAGGHLAALAGLAGDGAFLSDEWPGVSAAVQAIAAGYPPTDFRQIDAQRDPTIRPSDDPESAHLPAPRPITDPQSLESLFLGARVGERPDLAARADPCRYARADAPPVLLLHGTADAAVPLGQSHLLYQALARAGATVTLAEVAGLGHGFLNRSDLDDRGPRSITLHRPGQARETRQGGVFALTRAFLGQSLGRPAG